MREETRGVLIKISKFVAAAQASPKALALLNNSIYGFKLHDKSVNAETFLAGLAEESLTLADQDAQEDNEKAAEDIIKNYQQYEQFSAQFSTQLILFEAVSNAMKEVSEALQSRERAIEQKKTIEYDPIVTNTQVQPKDTDNELELDMQQPDEDEAAVVKSAVAIDRNEVGFLTESRELIKALEINITAMEQDVAEPVLAAMRAEVVRARQWVNTRLVGDVAADLSAADYDRLKILHGNLEKAVTSTSGKYNEDVCNKVLIVAIDVSNTYNLAEQKRQDELVESARVDLQNLATGVSTSLLGLTESELVTAALKKGKYQLKKLSELEVDLKNIKQQLAGTISEGKLVQADNTKDLLKQYGQLQQEYRERLIQLQECKQVASNVLARAENKLDSKIAKLWNGNDELSKRINQSNILVNFTSVDMLALNEAIEKNRAALSIKLQMLYDLIANCNKDDQGAIKKIQSLQADLVKDLAKLESEIDKNLIPGIAAISEACKNGYVSNLGLKTTERGIDFDIQEVRTQLNQLSSDHDKLLGRMINELAASIAANASAIIALGEKEINEWFAVEQVLRTLKDPDNIGNREALIIELSLRMQNLTAPKDLVKKTSQALWELQKEEQRCRIAKRYANAITEEMKSVSEVNDAIEKLTNISPSAKALFGPGGIDVYGGKTTALDDPAGKNFRLEAYLALRNEPSSKALHDLLDKEITRLRAPILLTKIDNLRTDLKSLSSFSTTPIATTEAVNTLLGQLNGYVDLVSAEDLNAPDAQEAVRNGAKATLMNEMNEVYNAYRNIKENRYGIYKNIEVACLQVSAAGGYSPISLDKYMEKVQDLLKKESPETSVNADFVKSVAKLYYGLNVIGHPEMTIAPDELKDGAKALTSAFTAIDNLHSRTDWEKGCNPGKQETAVDQVAPTTPGVQTWLPGDSLRDAATKISADAKFEVSIAGGRRSLSVNFKEGVKINDPADKEKLVRAYAKEYISGLGTGKGDKIYWGVSLQDGCQYAKQQGIAEGVSIANWKQCMFSKDKLTEFSKCMPKERGQWAEWMKAIYKQDKKDDAVFKASATQFFDLISPKNIEDGGKALVECLTNLMRVYENKKSDVLEVAIKLGIAELLKKENKTILGSDAGKHLMALSETLKSDELDIKKVEKAKDEVGINLKV